MQKLHIDEFYRKTVSPDTADCEPDPGFNYDKASTFVLCLIRWKVRFLWTRSTSGSTSKRIASCPATEGFTWTTSPSAQPPASMRWLSIFCQSWKTTTQLWGQLSSSKHGLKCDLKGLQDCRLLFWSYSCDQWTQQYKVHIICVIF